MIFTNNVKYLKRFVSVGKDKSSKNNTFLYYNSLEINCSQGFNINLICTGTSNLFWRIISYW